MTLREAAEDLRDGAAQLVAALISGRLEDASYIFNALILDSVKEVERKIHAAQVTKEK
jgi:hypothetical protein